MIKGIVYHLDVMPSPLQPGRIVGAQVYLSSINGEKNSAYKGAISNNYGEFQIPWSTAAPYRLPNQTGTYIDGYLTAECPNYKKKTIPFQGRGGDVTVNFGLEYQPALSNVSTNNILTQKNIIIGLVVFGSLYLLFKR
ncbi:MAG: hypothetical protein WCK09_13675 [Bacteroidota bacterium]